MAEIWSTAEKVAKLVLKEAESLHKVMNEVESVKKKLRSMGSKLKEADIMIDRDGNFDQWASELRDLAFKAEDVVEVFVNKATPYDEEDGCAIYFQLIMGCFHQISTLHKLKNEINDINGKLEELLKESPQIQKGSPDDGETSSRHRREKDWASIEIGEDGIVGFQKEEEELTLWLTREEPLGQPVVVTIWAQGGAGKSTLAHKIYKSSSVKNHFDFVAWASVSQEYHAKDIWQAILKQIGQLTPNEETETVAQVKVNAYLKERNYLIILDDLWKVKDLNIIEDFPTSHQKKCRFLLTTRDKEVAHCAGPYQQNLRLLNAEEGMELFLKKVYRFSPQEIPSVSKEMKDVAREMLSKWCEGLPIAIVLLGGILSSKEKDPIQWGNIRDKVHSDLVNEGGLRKVLSLSYNQLPYELRSCFLYFGLFPEDSLINCDRLIRLWVAEGFLERGDGDDHIDQAKEDVAGECLKHLIERSMIQLVERKSNGDPQTCRTHDLIRDLAMKEGNKAKFSSISMDKYVGSSTLQSNSRRIALHDTWSCTVPNQSKASSSGHPPSLTLQQPRPRVVDHEGDVGVVGLQKEADDLARWLTKEEPLGRIAVVSIVGGAGMGKTALARKVYNRNDVTSHFAYRAWVHVSDNSFEMKNILRTILQQVASSSMLTDDDAEIQVNKEGEEESLQRMVHNLFLQGESYLIVFDNVLQQKYWDAIKMVFPNKPLNKDQKCRVLLTTRCKTVALHADLTTRDEEVARLDAHPTTCDEEVVPLDAHPTTSDEEVDAHPTTCDGEVDEEVAMDADSTTMFSGIITSDEEADLYDNLPASCCYLGFLNEELSLKLFLKTIFKCSLDEMPAEACSEEMRIIATELVVNHCEKLPYVILALGSLLSQEENYLWTYILEPLNNFKFPWIFFLGQDKRLRTMQVFAVCYVRLPDYLASCIRYFNSMPLESEISCDSLRQSWVEQGFLESRDNYSMEQVARDSLEELIQRNLIDVTEWRSNGDPQTCRMHTEFHKVILYKLSVLDVLRMNMDSILRSVNGTSSTTTTTTTDTATGTDHQPKTFNLIHLLSKVLADPFHLPNHVYYSLLCFSRNHDLPLVLASREFQLLRVVDLQAGAENILELPIQIKNLTFLRYLSLRGTRVEVIPTWIAKLRNLETLDAPASLIPMDTLKLHQLRHLFAHSFHSPLPPVDHMNCDSSSSSCINIGALKHLHTLELLGDNCDLVIGGLDKLTNLRVLRICVDYCDRVSLSSAIANLTGLKFLRLTQSLKTKSAWPLLSFSRHSYLNEMILENFSFPMPNDFPPRLTFLWLDLKGGQGDVNVFSTLQQLSYLKKLCLRVAPEWREVRRYTPMTCSTEGFPKLESLYIGVYHSLRDWNWEAGALRSLRVLHIDGGHTLGELPDGLRHVTNLKELILTRCYDVRWRILHREGREWEIVKGLGASIKFLDHTTVNLPP